MNLTIKDLAVAKELSHEERAAVCGGVVRKAGGATDGGVEFLTFSFKMIFIQ
jgi:hypothetical protein